VINDEVYVYFSGVDTISNNGFVGSAIVSKNSWKLKFSPKIAFPNIEKLLITSIRSFDTPSFLATISDNFGLMLDSESLEVTGKISLSNLITETFGWVKELSGLVALESTEHANIVQIQFGFPSIKLDVKMKSEFNGTLRHVIVDKNEELVIGGSVNGNTAIAIRDQKKYEIF
jgi:hypothetical protein